MAKGISVKALNALELEFLKEKIEWLLSNKGMKVEHEEVEQYQFVR